MTIETLWITLPTNEENELKNIISSISSKNLTNLSIKQLIKKLENNQAADWIEVLAQYNAIPSVKNINTSEMLNRAESVRDKFGERGFPKLKDRQFEPRELLSLVILCYSNPTLIGRNLCTALNDNNNENVEKEMIQFSAYRTSENRVLPSQSNLRLLSTALYFNNTDIRLPNSVIDRVTRETIRDRRIVRKLDQRGGFEERIDGPARARSEGNQEIVARRKRSERDSYAVLKSLKSSEYDATEKGDFLPQLVFPVTASQISHSDNGTELTSEVLPSTNNAANSSYANGLIIGSLVGFHALKNLPVISPVLRNMGKDLVTAGKHIGSFFSRNVESEEQQDQKTALLSPTAKS